MTPAEIKLAVQLAIAGLALGAAAAGGWTLNGWRLGAELEQTRKDRDLAIAQGNALAAATEACSKGVERAERLAAAAVAQGQALLREAQAAAQSGRQQAARLEDLMKRPAPPGADCNKAWDDIEKLGQP